MIEGNIKRYIVGIVTVLVLLGICVNIDYAMNNTEEEIMTINNTSNQTVEVNDSYVDFYNKSTITVKPTDQLYSVEPHITATGKPSCGCRYSYRYWYTRTYVNYCPNCHRYNTLLINPKCVYEKEITCKACSSDFCIVCGKEKYSWSRTYLRR